MERGRSFFTGASVCSCATGRTFPPPSINSERTAHVWKKPSNESTRIAEATLNRGKRTQPRPDGWRLGRNGGRRSHGYRPCQVLRLDRLGGSGDGDGPRGVPMWQGRGRQRQTLLAENHS